MIKITGMLQLQREKPVGTFQPGKWDYFLSSFIFARNFQVGRTEERFPFTPQPEFSEFLTNYSLLAIKMCPPLLRLKQHMIGRIMSGELCPTPRALSLIYRREPERLSVVFYGKKTLVEIAVYFPLIIVQHIACKSWPA